MIRDAVRDKLSETKSQWIFDISINLRGKKISQITFFLILLMKEILRKTIFMETTQQTRDQVIP